MKKHPKTAAVNNQEMEDFEAYTLYPENAIIPAKQKTLHKNHNASVIKNNTDKILQLSKKNHSRSKNKLY